MVGEPSSVCFCNRKYQKYSRFSFGSLNFCISLEIIHFKADLNIFDSLNFLEISQMRESLTFQYFAEFLQFFN